MRSLILVLATLAVIPASAGIIASNNFNVNGESWTGLTADPTTSGLPITLNNLAVTYTPAGGNPTGYVAILDADSNDTYFAAPAAYLGNIEAALNGTLTFDGNSDQTLDYAGPLIVIKGNGIVLVYQVSPQPYGLKQWNPVSVPIAPGANWHLNTGSGAAASLADFQTALSNVTALWITAETHNGIAETVGIDNVVLSNVPEPSSLLLMGCGLAAASLLRRPRA